MEVKLPLRGVDGTVVMAQNGAALPLCVLHQISPFCADGAQANFTLGGVSMCLNHMEYVFARIDQQIMYNISTDVIVQGIIKVELAARRADAER